MYALIVEFVFVDAFTFWRDGGSPILPRVSSRLLASARGVMTDGTPLGVRQMKKAPK
jgi:hypothetical protein